MPYQKLQVSQAIKVVPSDTINIPLISDGDITGAATATTANKLVDTEANWNLKFVDSTATAGTTGTALFDTAVNFATNIVGSIAQNKSDRLRTATITARVSANEVTLSEDIGLSSGDDYIISVRPEVVNTVSVGDIVYNITDSTAATITAIDSETTLSLSANIMANTEKYRIFTENADQEGCVLYVGSAGDVAVLPSGADDSVDDDFKKVIYKGVLAGSFIPVNVKRVYSTGTTATEIIANW